MIKSKWHEFFFVGVSVEEGTGLSIYACVCFFFYLHDNVKNFIFKVEPFFKKMFELLEKYLLHVDFFQA